MGRRAIVLAAASSVLMGCSLLTSLDDLGSGDGGGGDAQPGDAVAADVASGDGGADASGNLLTNASFDDGQGGCGPNWGNGYGMTFTRVSPGRTGPYACLVCMQGGPTSYALESLVAVPANAGPYYAEAWVTTPDGGVTEQGGVGVLIAYDIDAGISGCGGVGSYCQGSISVPPTGSWVKSSASFVANGPGTLKVMIHTYGPGTVGSCFVVDDVALYAQ